MFKEKLIKGLICLLAIGVLGEMSWVVAKDATKRTGTAQAIGTQTLEPKPIMEYKLPEGEEIVDVIFDEATMTVKEARALGMKGLEQRRTTETVKVQYPKVVATKGAVHPGLRIIKGTVTFLNEKGSTINQIFLREIKLAETGGKRWLSEECYLSSNGEYAGVITASSRIPEKTEKTSFCLMDKNGNVLWKKESMGYDIDECKILDDGRRILLIDRLCPLGEEQFLSGFYIYDEKGTQILKQEYTGDVGEVVMSNNGKYVVGIVSIYIEGVEGRISLWEDWLVFYDIEGKKSWKYKVKAKLGGHISLSETGEVVVKDDEHIYSFTKDGKLKEKRRR